MYDPGFVVSIDTLTVSLLGHNDIGSTYADTIYSRAQPFRILTLGHSDEFKKCGKT